MKNPIVSLTGWLLLLSALGFYGYGIGKAISLSWSLTPISDKDFPATIATTISTAQALLLTNLGILLGIAITKPTSVMASQLMLSRTKIALADVTDPLLIRDKVQLFALVIYILSLITCLVTWIKNDFSSNPAEVVPLVAESGKMFIGVVLAYLTAVLGR
jgi:hypothetical protein